MAPVCRNACSSQSSWKLVSQSDNPTMYQVLLRQFKYVFVIITKTKRKTAYVKDPLKRIRKRSFMQMLVYIKLILANRYIFHLLKKTSTLYLPRSAVCCTAVIWVYLLKMNLLFSSFIIFHFILINSVLINKIKASSKLTLLTEFIRHFLN